MGLPIICPIKDMKIFEKREKDYIIKQYKTKLKTLKKYMTEHSIGKVDYREFIKKEQVKQRIQLIQDHLEDANLNYKIKEELNSMYESLKGLDFLKKNGVLTVKGVLGCQIMS